MRGAVSGLDWRDNLISCGGLGRSGRSTSTVGRADDDDDASSAST